jgi:hypothetical protein
MQFSRGIGDYVLVDFLRESGFAKREAKKGESLAKRHKMGVSLCGRKHLK